MIHFAVDELRLDLLTHYLAREWGRPLRDCVRQISYQELFRRRALPRGAWIFTALDALSVSELEMVHHIQTAVRAAGLPVLNPAREALHRYELLRGLRKAGLNDFQVHRADEPWDSVRFPVFVRLSDEHNGSLTPLLRNRAELHKAMAYLWMRGLARRQLLIVEFCDTASADGLYRKYSVFRIGDSYVRRYLHIAKDWMAKNDTRSLDEKLAREEVEYLSGDLHADWVRRIFEIAHIEYGRLDYSVRGSRPQAWEINFTPVLTGNPDRLKPEHEDERARSLVRAANEHAHLGLREAFLRIDPGPIAGEDIPLGFPLELEEQARRERAGIEHLARRRGWIARISAAPGVRSVCQRIRKSAIRR